MRLLYYAPFNRGGMAEYSHHQAAALSHLGVEVTMLCPAHDEGPWNRVPAAQRSYALRPVLRGWQPRKLPAPLRKILFTRDLLLDAHALADLTRREHYPRVLFAAYSEHFAPLWAGRLRRLTRERGTVIGAVVHDPVRLGGVGPRWWHRWSVAAKYAIMREAFIHAPLTLDTIRPMPALRTTVIPHGIYEAPPSRTSRAEWRDKHGLPPGAKVLLSFGHIRDGKNLDLAMHALTRFPDLYLVVAGKEQSSAQRNANFYQALAQKLGVADRCRWMVGFIPDEKISEIFGASDLLLLTYSRGFRSASGVLNVAANFGIPCVASGGEGNLHHAVQKYRLGAWIEPDSLAALVEGIETWLRGSMPTPRWEDYMHDNSWLLNAKIVAEKMDASSPDNSSHV